MGDAVRIPSQQFDDKLLSDHGTYVGKAFSSAVGGDIDVDLHPGVLVFSENAGYARIRRTIDIVLALAMLVAVIPVLLLAIMLAYLEDGGPVFFRQRRVGRYGRPFVMYKLRTMHVENCVDRFSPTANGDPRVTRTGVWLRRTSIDELPQLINILRGEMTFVGPRPEMPFVVRNYQAWQHLRLLVTPGVTGLWQITCRKSLPMHLPEATLIDLQYIRSASLRTDAAVLAKTLRSVVSAQGAF